MSYIHIIQYNIIQYNLIYTEWLKLDQKYSQIKTYLTYKLHDDQKNATINMAKNIYDVHAILLKISTQYRYIQRDK